MNVVSPVIPSPTLSAASPSRAWSRDDILHNARRIVIKAGTAVVSTTGGYPSLPRLGAIVEQIAAIVKSGREVILVSSGAVGCGRLKLRKAQAMNSSIGSQVLGDTRDEMGVKSLSKGQYDSACAGAGQLSLISLYDTLFGVYDVEVSQLLLTNDDFNSESHLRNLRYSLSTLMRLGVVPVLNENDAVSANKGYLPDSSFSDNDMLASLIAREVRADLLLILTDVEGVYDRPPSLPDAKVISTIIINRDDVEQATSTLIFGDKSAGGRGGMEAKVTAAVKAVIGGVHACVVASGCDATSIKRTVMGDAVGTMFVRAVEAPDLLHLKASVSSVDAPDTIATSPQSMRDLAVGARHQAQALLSLSTTQRRAILAAIAAALDDPVRRAEILHANAQDVDAATTASLDAPLLKRLSLSSTKLDELSSGVRALLALVEPLGRVVRRCEVATQLQLTQVTVPIGVLLVIFESRPDSLVQIAALALLSGNGLLLKGGKEAESSNAILHRVIVDAVVEASQGAVGRDVIGLVNSRAQVRDLLKLDRVIDLVIPRGSNALVQSIRENTRIPVLGHADGVCHVYVDATCDVDTAIAITIDAKCHYPAACNAMETLLLHRHHLDNGTADRIVRALRQQRVSLRGGPRAVVAGLVDRDHGLDMSTTGDPFHLEYSSETLTVEVVDDVDSAVRHINAHGSGHTECVVTTDRVVAERFLSTVDSACVFWNASTRFADGYRFGLGAEVGISTGRIHARGPVGVEGLLTTKYLLSSAREAVGERRPGGGHVVADFEQGDTYLHRHF